MTGMHRIVSKRLSVILRLLLAVVLSSLFVPLIGCKASGRSERATSYMYAAVPADQVKLYFEPIRRDYNLIATLSSEARVSEFGSAAETEAAVYEKLRDLAARNGATAVIDIEVTPADISIAEEISAKAKAVRFR